MKTPMQERLEWVRVTLPMDLDTPRLIEQKIESMLEKETEKDKMHKVWKDSASNFVRASNGFDFYTSFEDYYNETFNTKKK